jgi:hypothetical protein
MSSYGGAKRDRDGPVKSEAGCARRGGLNETEERGQRTDDRGQKKMVDANTINLLIAALIAVESGGDANAVNGDAVGILQLRPIFVDEANRLMQLYGSQLQFDYQARKDVESSKVIVKVWFRHNLKNHSLQECVRKFNAGKNWRGSAAAEYWKKVKKEMKK